MQYTAPSSCIGGNSFISVFHYESNEIICYISEVFRIKLYSYVMLGFVAVIVLIHSELFHQISLELFGFSLKRLFTFGLAFQYIFNHYFQPSVFVVLIIISLYFFQRKKYVIAVIFASSTMAFGW